MPGESIFAKGIKVTNQALNHGVAGRWVADLDDASPYQGFGDIAVDSADMLYLVWSSRTQHESDNGLIKAAISDDYGATFGTPTTLAAPTTGRDLRDTTISIDPVTGMFYVVYNDCDQVEGNTPDVVQILRGPSLDALTPATVTQPYAARTFARSKVHRLNNYLYLPVCGRESATTLAPALLISGDEGVTWTVQSSFPEVDGNESCLYFARVPDDPLDFRMFLLTRRTSYAGGTGLVLYTDYAGEFGNVWQGPLTVPFSTSGGPAVFQMDGYLMMIARNDRRGHHGFVSYSLDGLDWSLPEMFTTSRPVYGSLARFSDGRILLAHTQENGAADWARMQLQWFTAPSYSEVVARLRGQLVDGGAL